MTELDILLKKLDEISDTEKPVLSEFELKIASQSRFVLVRCKVCDAAIYYPPNFARELLLTLLSDRNADVRASAACYLEYYPDTSVIEALKKSFFYDKDPYVRGYGGYSLLKIASFDDQTVSAVESSLSKERNLFTRACCYGALYHFCNKKTVLSKIIYCFQSKNYRTRCATAHTLMEILNTENASEILRAVESVLKTEDAFSVQDNLERLRKKTLKQIGERQ